MKILFNIEGEDDSCTWMKVTNVKNYLSRYTEGDYDYEGLY